MDIRGNFGELNTDLPAELTRSGTASVALNVSCRNGKLAKRKGFEQEDDAGAKLSAYVASNGTVHYRTTAGWFYEWAGYVYFTSAAGSTKATNVKGTGSFKAGLPRPSCGSLAAAESASKKGGKEGEYRVAYTYYNSVTQEESVIGETQASIEPAKCRASDDAGALALEYIALVSSTTPNYNYDYIRIYCSNGNSERLFNPVCTRELYLDKSMAKATTATIYLPDHMHGTPSSPRYTNAGGEPPACTMGAFDGTTAVYFLADYSLEFSIPNYPTMVPRAQSYTLTSGDYDLSSVVEPLPWRGRVNGAFIAAPVSAHVVSGRIIVFTSGHTYEISRSGDGRMTPRILLPNIGCPSRLGAAVAGSSIYFLSNRELYRLGPNGLQGLASGHWKTTLDDINASTAIVAYYSYLDEIWISDSATTAMYIVDAKSGVLKSKWTGGPCGACTCMVEKPVAGSNSVMYLGDADGWWTYDPNGDTKIDDEDAFVSTWTGWFGQESPDQKFLEALAITVGTSDEGDLNVKLAAATYAALPGETTNIVLASTGFYFDDEDLNGDREGRLFQITFTSSAEESQEWEIDHLVLRLKGAPQ